MKDIAKFSEVSYTALKEIWKEFVKRKVVVHTRNVGKAKMYKLNRENPSVEKFIDYYWSVVNLEVEKEVGILKNPEMMAAIKESDEAKKKGVKTWELKTPV